jgi:uncharacterized protein YbjT (DUF2867 family)
MAAIGGTGLIGSKTVVILRRGGHEVVAASPKGGVNSVMGEGLAKAIVGAQVVTDLSNAPSSDAKAVLEFFETSGRKLVTADRSGRSAPCHAIYRRDRSGTRPRLLPSQSCSREADRGFRIPYTITCSTQAQEFLGGIADASTDGKSRQACAGPVQPIAADDVAGVVAEVALANPRNGIVERVGPERAPLNEIVARYGGYRRPAQGRERSQSPIFRRAT